MSKTETKIQYTVNKELRAQENCNVQQVRFTGEQVLVFAKANRNGGVPAVTMVYLGIKTACCVEDYRRSVYSPDVKNEEGGNFSIDPHSDVRPVRPNSLQCFACLK